MSDPIKVTQRYNLSHADMLEASKDVKELFVGDKPAFLIFDLSFGGTFQNDWEVDITAAEGFDTDEVVLDQLTQLTKVVEEKMDLCRHKFQSAKYFIERAFPDNGAVWDEFGYDNYDDARENQPLMVQFMKNFHKKAVKYSAKLILKNYTQIMIDEILVLSNAFDTANSNQNAFITARKTVTQTRQTAYNKVWDYVVRVCKAGQIIFHDNAAKFEQYLTPRAGTSPPITQSISFILLLTDADRTVNFDYVGGIFATGDMLTQTWETGTFNTVVLSNGIHGVLNWTYATGGEKEPKLTGGIDTIGEMNISNNRIIRFIPVGSNKCRNFNASGNNFDEPGTNGALIWLDANDEEGGTVDLSGGTNAPPTGDGIIAKNSLIAKGWTVITN